MLADYRDPDVIRLGCSPLTTRFADVARATIAIAELPRRHDRSAMAPDRRPDERPCPQTVATRLTSAPRHRAGRG